MSLAEKLYRIGECVEDDDIIHILRQKLDLSDKKTNFLLLDFVFDNDNYLEMRIVTQNIKTEFFLTGSIGGRGSGYFYLYPNLIFENKVDKKGKPEIEKKLEQFINTLNNYLDKGYTEQIAKIEAMVKALKTDADKFLSLAEEKKEYLFAILVNSKSLFERMPEILTKYLENPVSEFSKGNRSLKRTGKDFISGKKTTIGFNPDVKIFTLDNYDDSHKKRIVDNLEISQESAKYINRGWLYTIKYLLFYYKGLNYLIIPNFIKQDLVSYKKILEAFKRANVESSIRSNDNRKRLSQLSDSISRIAKEEASILKMIEKSKTKKQKKNSPSLLGELESNEGKLHEIQHKIEELQKEKNNLELLIKDDLLDEIDEAISKEELRKFLNAISLDLIFVNYDAKYGTLTNIYGTIQDVLPSKISAVKEKMRSHNIVDGIKLKNKDYTKTYLQDYFARFELQAKLSPTINEKNVQNMIFKERIYLAKLLLSDEQIDYENLFNRFEEAREFDYSGKKRVNDKGIKDWLENTEQYLSKEQQVIKFLKSIESLKGEEYGG